MAPRTGTAEVNGTRLYFEVEGSGPGLVFLHAFACDRRMWDAQFAHFADAYRVVRYDARGYGLSDPPSGERYAHGEDLRALLDYLEMDSAILCGSSMGGQNAIETALRHPSRVRALVLVGFALQGYGFSAETAAFVGSVVTAARTEGLDAARRLWVENDFVPGPRDVLRAMTRDYSGWHWLNDNLTEPLQPPMMERLGEISVPALAIGGAKDHADMQAMLDYFVERAPSTQRVTFDDAAHYPSLEDADRFNAVVGEFLARL